MVLASDDSILTYPNNKPYDVRVHLSTPISLTGNWTVSLLEISIERRQANPTSELFVFSNLCGNTVLGGHDVPLLRRVWLKDVKQNKYIRFLMTYIYELDCFRTCTFI